MSSSSPTLSLRNAVLINVNIMLGAGVFINTVELAKRTGFFSGFMYPLGGLLVLPLIICIAKLTQMYPDGGFYGFGAKYINSFAGFMSGWSYFTGKLASATLMIHVSMSLLSQALPILKQYNIFTIDLIILLLFIALNTLNMRTGSKIQTAFFVLKSIPLLTVIISGLVFISGSVPLEPFPSFATISSVLPLVLYAAMGFESICSLSRSIENPKKNGPRAIIISYSVVMTVLFLYQTLIYALLSKELVQLPSYLYVFSTFFNHLMSNNLTLAHHLARTIWTILACSALGGAYGILYSNNWNLYILASHKHTFFARTLTRLNNAGIPVFCMLIQALICIFYMFFTYLEQVSLQQLAALAVTLSYTICVLALLAANMKEYNWHNMIVPLLGLASCSIFIHACVHNFKHDNVLPLYSFLALLAFGSIMYLYQKFATKKHRV